MLPSRKGTKIKLPEPPEFVLFVNDPRLLSQTYRRYLESRIRDAESFPGLPIILTFFVPAQRVPDRSIAPTKEIDRYPGSSR